MCATGWADSAEFILFLTDESDKSARSGFSLTAGGVHSYLNRLDLAPHETHAIDLPKLRDARQPDLEKNLIPTKGHRWQRELDPAGQPGGFRLSGSFPKTRSHRLPLVDSS